MGEQSAKPTLYLIDGSNYLYRAFYAIRELSNSKGFPTNAIYGFTAMLMKLCRDHGPAYMAVVFDSRGPTFRHEAFDQYKATRKAMPDELSVQVPHVKEVVRGFSIPVLEEQGMEADDIIGTLVRRHGGASLPVVMVSGDKDLLQLVSPDVVMIDTMKDKTYDVAGVRERFGVEPEKVVEVLGLAGDASDNIPGVPGVGEKTAQKLIREFGTIEGVYEHLDDVTNSKTRESLREHRAQALLSRDLAVIRTDAAVPVTLEALRRGEPDSESLKRLFREFEFTRLLRDLPQGAPPTQGEYRTIASKEDLQKLVKRLAGAGECAVEGLCSSEEPMRAKLLGMSLSPAPGEAYYVPLTSGDAGGAKALDSIAPIMENDTIRKHGYDLKHLLIVLSRQGVALEGLGCDVMVAAYVLNPSKRDFGLPAIALEYLNEEIPGGSPLHKDTAPVDEMSSYLCRRADAVLRLAARFQGKIEEEGFSRLFNRVEMPLVEVLASMERKGVLIDVDELHAMSVQLEQLLALSEKKIYGLAGEEFNINSPKQLQVILFDKLGLPKGKKTKGGYSTDVEVLTALAVTYELPAEILAYRSFAKLKSTYIDALPALINPATGRVHTSYNQTVTATGRLSSSNPNLQNIPIRTPEGRRIRRAFIAPEGYLIISADYSQIELRVLAHLSGDRALIEVFKEGGDIHAQTASKIFGVFPEMVNPEMRRQAKVINFGIIYGMSPFGLAKELGISQALARTYIDEYFHRFPDVRRYLDATMEAARKDGYVTTLLNRRRYIPEIMSTNAAVRQFAERTAVNTPLQGTAADIIKVAMCNIAGVLRERDMKTVMIMQVHDELVFEAAEEEVKSAVAAVRREMEGVIELKVPLVVDVAVGRNWDEAH